MGEDAVHSDSAAVGGPNGASVTSARLNGGTESGPACCEFAVRVKGVDHSRRLASAVMIGGGSLAVLGVFAAMFVGWYTVEQRYFPTISTGLRHALLTVQAAIVTATAAGFVYGLMRRQHRRLSDTAERLTRILESYQKDPANPLRFENPHLVNCRTLARCNNGGCQMLGAAGERCWQIMALRRAAEDVESPSVAIQRCHDCEVYRRSCPDKLTELGEAFNNLLFLLEEKARQVRLMRAQMVEKEKMAAIGQMATGIAHEVGNPLSSISAVVQMLKRHPSSDSYDEQLDLIQTHIKRISTTVRQLVSLARPGPVVWERVDIVALLDEVVRLIGFDNRAKDVKVVFDPLPSLPVTYALRNQLQQVVINLALNSLDAMPRGGTLTIEARQVRRDIIVTLTDTGEGIGAATGRRVFEPFYTTKEPGHGTGLGLAVSYGIIQKHGGSIDFQSVENQGTTFTVTLPILNAAPEEEHGTSHHTFGG